VIDLLAEGKIEEAILPESEKELLRVAELITRNAYRMTPERIQALRDLGWSEPQIAEMVYVTALFAFFNRVADAFGIDSQGYGGPRPSWAEQATDSVTIAASNKS
jgi:alkylhydroperoxidase family enzyme